MTSAGRPLRVKSAGRQGAHVGANFRNAPVTGQPRPNRLTSAKRQQTTSDEKVHRMRRRRLRAPERERHSTAKAPGALSPGGASQLIDTRPPALDSAPNFTALVASS